MSLLLASCLTALNSSGSVLLGCGFAWLRAPTTPTWALVAYSSVAPALVIEASTLAFM